MAHKVGDTVRITDKKYGHEFKIGQLVKISSVEIDKEGDAEFYSDDEGKLMYGWYFRGDECELFIASTTSHQEVKLIKRNSLSIEEMIMRDYAKEPNDPRLFAFIYSLKTAVIEEFSESLNSARSQVQ